MSDMTYKRNKRVLKREKKGKEKKTCILSLLPLFLIVFVRSILKDIKKNIHKVSDA